jgi:phage protein D
MAEIVNLRTARKQKARAEARAEASANAARHGQSKAERALRTAEAEKAARSLDGHRLEREPGDDEGR